MEGSLLKNFKTIGELQKCIANAETLYEAFQECLRIIVDGCDAQYAVIWYDSKTGDNLLHPYHWICPLDLTSRAHAPGDGSVGRVYDVQTAERLLDFEASPDPQTAEDFGGIQIGPMVCVPFSSKYEKLGCIQFLKERGKEPFTEEEADICEIMTLMAAMAIEDNERIQEPWKKEKVVISIRNICREFKNGDRTTQVLKGVNLDIYEGEFLAILGESGCGKSTLLNTIGGMNQPTSGTFTYLGEDYSHATQQQLTEYRRFNIGFIFQSYNLMPNLNARQNLELIGEFVSDPMSADDALELVGLSEKKNNYPSQLSGGQQQRVSIARALMKRPKVIIADEPTAALDYTTSIEVLSEMEKIVSSGTTLIMVTHNEEITKMADRVVHMRDGKMYKVTINRHRAHAEELVW